MRVRFLETRIVDDHRKGTSLEEKFEVGRTYELPPTSADRWVNRGVAEYVEAVVEKAVKAAVVETPAEVAPTAQPTTTERRSTPRPKPTA